MQKTRLDEWLVQLGLYQTRARARDAVVRGCVKVDGITVDKPSHGIKQSPIVQVDDPAKSFVSRAAIKLLDALNETSISVKDKICLDIGASTGGFSEVLLNEGARHVFGVDVGHGQMAPQLLQNKRLTNIEGVNARELTLSHLNDIRPDIITCDVSFISLKLALPPALAFAADDAKGLFLVKPQFEAGRDAIGKGGIVRSAAEGREVAIKISDWLDGQPGWHSTKLLESSITGSDGNTEFVLVGEKDD